MNKMDMPNCSICGTPYCQWEVRGDDVRSCPVCDVAPGKRLIKHENGETTLFDPDSDSGNFIIIDEAKELPQDIINKILDKLPKRKSKKGIIIIGTPPNIGNGWWNELFMGSESTNSSEQDILNKHLDKHFQQNKLQAEFRKMRAEAEAEVQRQMDEIRRKLDGGEES